MVLRFEEDGGLHMGDAEMQDMDDILTSCRAIVGVASNLAEEKLEHVDDVMKTWEQHGSKKRSPTSLVAGAFHSEDFWRERMVAITSDPLSWRKMGPAMTEFKDAIESLDLEASDVESVASLRKLCDQMQVLLGTLGDDNVGYLRKRLWDHLLNFWNGVKRKLDRSEHVSISLTDVLELLS